jgi:fucose 4-O-acetylase-like acetyltransferase
MPCVHGDGPCCYGHLVLSWSEYFVFTSPIKVPLFFAITGFVFNNCKEEKTFYYKLFRQIIIPWLFFGLVPYIAAAPLKGFDYLKDMVIAVLSGKKS